MAAASLYAGRSVICRSTALQLVWALGEGLRRGSAEGGREGLLQEDAS